MRPVFQPQLVNGPSGDPGLYVDFLFERRALLFDLGDLGALPTRKLLRVAHAFVSHAHMDHFVGFDRLLRTCLGRAHAVALFGPPGFVAQVGHRLAAYTWNLVANYETNFTLTATELAPDGATRSARFQCRHRFVPEPLAPATAPDGVLLDDDACRVRAAVLDHQVPCLGFALEEKPHVNIWKNRLAELGLAVGPWLRELKRAVARGDDDRTPLRAAWREGGAWRERVLPLGELRSAVRVVPGQKIGYVTDVIGHADNRARIAALVRDADLLYIEAMFVDDDAAHAARKFHLTARAAGEIARAAGARNVVPFHLSPRYAGMEWRVTAELAEGFDKPPRVANHGNGSTAPARSGALAAVPGMIAMTNVRPSGPSGVLSAGELAAIAAKLDARHRALLEEIRDELEKSENQQYIELVGNVPTDLGDQSVGDALADLELAIIDRHVTELRDLEAARDRMRKGDFGICIACGTDIGYERLLAYPTAMRCLACQEQHERTYAHGGTPTL